MVIGEDNRNKSYKNILENEKGVEAAGFPLFFSKDIVCVGMCIYEKDCED